MALQRRKKMCEADAEVGPIADGGPFTLDCPSLVEFLGSSVYSDGTVRITGTAMLLTEGGRWKVWLHDRDAGEGCFVSGATLRAALTAAESAISTGEADWRPDRKRK